MIVPALVIAAAVSTQAQAPDRFGDSPAARRGAAIPAAAGQSDWPRTQMQRLVDQVSGETVAPQDDRQAEGGPGAGFPLGRDPFDSTFGSGRRTEDPVARRGASLDAAAETPPQFARVAREPTETREAPRRAIRGDSPRGQSPSPGDEVESGDGAGASQTKEARQWSLLIFFLLASIGVNVYQWIWYMKMRLRQQSLLFRMHDRVEARESPVDRGWDVEVDEDDDRLVRRSA